MQWKKLFKIYVTNWSRCMFFEMSRFRDHYYYYYYYYYHYYTDREELIRI
jgi:hypothetical protein